MIKIAALLLSAGLATSALAQSADWQKTWDDTLAAAKTEGKVVIIGSPEAVMRNEIIPKFTEKFGIQVEYIAGSSGQLSGRMRTERQSGIYSVDVYMSGAGTTLNVLYPEKMIDPLKPLLILPEVTEAKYWKRGKPFFSDPEGSHVFMLFSSVDSLMFINGDKVKPEEIRKAEDLLNPKWTGKISAQDPVSSGSGNTNASHWLRQKGEDFFKKLYVDQKVTFSRDRRQLTDWLARGTHPICIGCRADDAAALKKDGFKLVEVYDIEGVLNRVNPSPFMMTYANKAPHPNAARIFINWMASKEALQIYSRSAGAATLRTDVDESFLPPETIPKSGVTYPDDTDYEWVTKGRVETGKKVREILKAR